LKKKINLRESLALVLWYGLYVIVVIVGRKLNQWRKQKEKEKLGLFFFFLRK